MLPHLTLQATNNGLSSVWAIIRRKEQNIWFIESLLGFLLIIVDPFSRTRIFVALLLIIGSHVEAGWLLAALMCLWRSWERFVICPARSKNPSWTLRGMCACLTARADKIRSTVTGQHSCPTCWATCPFVFAAGAYEGCFLNHVNVREGFWFFCCCFFFQRQPGFGCLEKLSSS